MNRFQITNALLRVENVTEELIAPFERPKDDLDFWVFELQASLLANEWFESVSRILTENAEQLAKMSSGGASITLFIEFSSKKPVLRIEPEFLRLLNDLKIGLEISKAIE